ncbi:MAG: nuclear transport factor 2 family protein [Croceibacterium sp.]
MLRWPLTAPLAAPLAALAPLTLLIAVPAAAQVATAEVDTLARDVSRVESVRAVKDLQRSYAQYAQFGLADEMAALFASDAAVTWGGTTVQGRPAILRWLKGRLGPVRGLAPGAMQTELIDEPLANLSADGTTAKVRWMFLALTGNGQGKTGVEGGILENEYKQEQGKWVIARQTFSPQYTGTYEKGWSNAGGGDLGMVPFHFTNDESGTPIPPATGPAPASGTTPTALDARIAALNTEDVVRNLVAAYGYYVDRKMWDDVVDLFTRDGTTTIAGTGEFTGAEGLRKAHETMGAQGLKQGELNDHLIFDTIVEVDPGATSATARSVVMGMIGDTHAGTASWSFQVQLVHLVLDQGLWKFRDLQIYPTMNANYADGWGKGGTYHLTKTLPAFVEPHPVTGQPVTVAGFTTVGAATPAAAPASAPALTGAEWLVDARRRYARSLAYDGVTNVSAAYGYYIDDFQWADMGGIFAKNGNKHSPFAGFYLGQDRINGAATAMYGKAPPTRSGISFHWRTQPVIHVSHDGRSANLRTRLFQPRTAKPPVPGAPASGLLNNTMNAGMYPNDQAVLENGIWRLWSLTIDEHYMSMNNWRDGWHGVKPVPPGQGAGQSPLVTRYPPDILMTTMGRRAEHFRGGTGVTLQWPDILPMWFHYKNPVSGRVPELYWPDSFPSLLLPQSRLIANGYQMPPNGPEQDGIQIELVPPEANVMEADAK